MAQELADGLEAASRSENDALYSAVYDLSTPLALNYGAPGMTVYKIPDVPELWRQAQATIDEEEQVRETEPFIGEENSEGLTSDEPNLRFPDEESDAPE